MSKQDDLNAQIKVAEEKLQELDDRRQELVDRIAKLRNRLNFIMALNDTDTVKFIKDAINEHELKETSVN